MAQEREIMETHLNSQHLYFTGSDSIDDVTKRSIRAVRVTMDKLREVLDKMFHAKSIAIIGASPRPGSVGNLFLKRLMDFGYSGKLFPVNPRYQEIYGLKCYPSVREIPEEVDLAIITIPANLVLRAVKECAEKGVPGVVIVSGGFKELGEEGRRLEEELTRIAKETGIRIIGPNCMGIYCPSSQITFHDKFPKESGDIGFISHSGGLCELFVLMMRERGLAMSKVISCGNECDLKFVDFLEYLEDDEETRVITGYVEQIREGRRFLEVAKRVTKKKPVIIWKAGRGSAGQRAIFSHTGALGGSDKIYNAVFKQVGVLRVNCLEEIIDLAMTFHCLSPRKVRNVAVITGPGGLGVAMVDAFESAGLQVPEFSKETQDRLKKIMPPVAGVKNPADLTLAIFEDIDLTRKAIEIIKEDDRIDAIAVGIAGAIAYLSPDAVNRILGGVLEASKESEKPVVAVWPHVGRLWSYVREFVRSGVPVYTFPEDAARGLRALDWYYTRTSAK